MSGIISKDKKRVVAIVPKDLVEKLEQIAFYNGRMSVSAYIVKLIDDEVKKHSATNRGE